MQQRSGGVVEMNEGLRCVIATCDYLLSSVEKAVSPSPAACDLLSESLQQHLEKSMQKVEFRKTHRGFFDVTNDPSKLSTLLEAQIIANREKRREGLDSAAVEEFDRKAKGMLLLLLRRESDSAAVLADSAGLLPDPVLPDFQVSPAVLPAFLGSAVERLRCISRDAVNREVYAGIQGLSLSRDHEHSLSDRRTAYLLHSIVSKDNAVMAKDGTMVAKDDVRVVNDAVMMASHRSSRSCFPTPVKGMRMPLRYLQQRTLPSSLIEAASKVAAREIRARKLHIVERCEERRDTQHAEKTSNDVVVHSSCPSVVVYGASLRSDGKDTQTESRSIALPDNHSCHKKQQQQQQQSLRRTGAAVNQASDLLVQVDDAPRSKRQRRKRKTLSEIMSGERIEQTDERLAIEDAQMPQDKRKTQRGKRQPQGSRPALTTKTVPVNAEEASNAPTTEQQHAWEHVSEMNEQETIAGHRISTRSHATYRRTLPDQEKTSVAAEGQGHRLPIMLDVDQDTHTHQRGNTRWNGGQQRSNEKDGAVHLDSAQQGTARREKHSQFIRVGREDEEEGEEGEYSQAVPVPVPSQEDEIQRQDGEYLDSRVECDGVVADKDSCRMGETLHLAAAGKQRSRKRRVGVGTNKNWAVVPDNAKEAERIAARPEGNESTTREGLSSVSVGEKAMITPATVDEEKEGEKGEKEPDGQSVSVREQETTTAREALPRHSTRRKTSKHDVLEEGQAGEKSLKCGSKNTTLSEREGVDVGIEKTTGSGSGEDDNARDHREKDDRPAENMSTRHLVRRIVDYHRNRGEELIIEDGAPVDHAGTKLDRAWGQTVLGIPIVEKGDRFLSRGETWRMVKRALSRLLRRDTNAGERSLVEDDSDQ